jgi:1-propanol dehydrogenase
MEEFHCATQIYIGCAEQILAQRHPKRLLIVADPYFQEGVAQKLGTASGGEASYFFEVTPDPSLSLAAKGAAMVKEWKPELVVALGGGSAIDCAKAMVYFSDCSPEFMAIPTTSGSGSEVTDFAILTHEGVKHPLVDQKLRPHMAVLDSSLVTNLPKSLIADGGFDALSHALEAYTATGSTCFTDALACHAFRLIYRQLPHSYGGCQKARETVHYGAAMAGLAFNQAGLGLCHGLSHSLGGLLHLPHGRLNAILLPEVIACNAAACGKQYASLARSIGLEGRSETLGVRNLKNALIRLRKELGLPGTLQEAGIPRSSVLPHLSALRDTVLADPCCKTNPVPVTPGMVEDILIRVTGHG